MSIERGPLPELTVDGFLEQLAARVPAPGGGATAALHAAQAAALLAMAARYTTGPRFVQHTEVISDTVDRCDAARDQALRLMAEDAAAFTAVTEAYGLPKDTAEAKEQRSDAVARALTAAARPPAQVVLVAKDVMTLAEALLPIANPNLVTDVAAAAEAARAAATTARLNVEINLPGIRDEQVRNELLGIVELVDQLAARSAAVEQAVRGSIA
ncbi:cyclodeaminase/cyclohydrolase family protein [Nocardioides sp. NPDC127503]|uniref:cyclodeaminase/cyclohydrolase family protein n=1 Tax=Nocardioides sp. NPDC127503 TaxID=3154516 RepID=UPI00332E0A21